MSLQNRLCAGCGLSIHFHPFLRRPLQQSCQKAKAHFCQAPQEKGAACDTCSTNEIILWDKWKMEVRQRTPLCGSGPEGPAHAGVCGHWDPHSRVWSLASQVGDIFHGIGGGKGCSASRLLVLTTVMVTSINSSSSLKDFISS